MCNSMPGRTSRLGNNNLTYTVHHLMRCGVCFFLFLFVSMDIYYNEIPKLRSETVGVSQAKWGWEKWAENTWSWGDSICQNKRGFGKNCRLEYVQSIGQEVRCSSKRKAGEESKVEITAKEPSMLCEGY